MAEQEASSNLLNPSKPVPYKCCQNQLRLASMRRLPNYQWVHRTWMLPDSTHTGYYLNSTWCSFICYCSCTVINLKCNLFFAKIWELYHYSTWSLLLPRYHALPCEIIVNSQVCMPQIHQYCNVKYGRLGHIDICTCNTHVLSSTLCSIKPHKTTVIHNMTWQGSILENTCRDKTILLTNLNGNPLTTL